MRIGDKIRALRSGLGLSVDDLAKRLGKNKATVYRYERGDIEKLPIDVLEPLANALETTPAYLLGWTSISTKTNSESTGIKAFVPESPTKPADDIRDRCLALKFKEEEYKMLSDYIDFVVYSRTKE